MTVIKKKNRQWSIIFGIVVILSMTWFFLLYQFNNEYTAKGEQPIQGILCLNEESAYNKLHYLSSEWQYFLGYLLTPQMLEKNPGYHSRYIYIGEYKEMEPGKQEKSDYSFGTYRMLITLPKKEQTWAISMMEVFSAYRIYINGELVGEVGNPDKNNYIGKSMNRMFTFRASGMVEIVITAADRKYMKSGIQYIPVFGSPVLVNIQREVQILLTGIALSICFCVMLGVLAIHLYTRNREFGIFVLVCLCVIGYTISSATQLFSAFGPALACPGESYLLSDSFRDDMAGKLYYGEKTGEISSTAYQFVDHSRFHSGKFCRSFCESRYFL